MTSKKKSSIMSDPNDLQLLSFYKTPPHECSYLEDQTAATIFADPEYPKNIHLYSVLSRYGFRRSGLHIYKPDCEHCKACTPVRLRVDYFSPNRNQRRCIKKNADLTITESAAVFKEDHYQLYCLYLASRHANGGMDNPTRKQYMDFLSSPWSATRFIEFHLEDQLLAIAVIDEIEDGLSAVYTFFDPQYAKRSLGTYAILHEIEATKQRKLNWLYLGYWIKDCQKMKYKTDFQPLDYFIDKEWRDEVT